MRCAIWLVGLAVGIASPASAQYRPQPAGADPRLQIVEYRTDRVVTLEVAGEKQSKPARIRERIR